MVVKENICIFGCKDSSVGQINYWIEDLTSYKIKFFISIKKFEKNKEKSQNKGVKKKKYIINNKIFNKKVVFLKNYIDFLKKNKIKKCLVLEDDPILRHQIYTKLKKNNFRLVTLIHPTVHLSYKTKVQEGTVIYPNCTIGYRTSIGVCCIIQPNCNLAHHNYIANFVNLNPNVNTGGFTEIGKFADIKMSANIINKIKIGNKCLIGASSLVLNNCLPNSLYYGFPAKFIKKRTFLN
jgi:acetyltransferase-like isoleucine patch superfamily enzyme